MLHVAADHFIIDAVNWLRAAQTRLLPGDFGLTAPYCAVMGTGQWSGLETRDRRLHGESKYAAASAALETLTE